jgi:hypothetical protein
MHELRRELVASASERASFRIVTHVHAWRADGCHRDIDLGVIHERERAFAGPRSGNDSPDGNVAFVRLSPEEVRENVVMHVDRERHRFLTGS